MLKSVIYFSAAMLSASAALAQSTSAPDPEFDQEEYNRRVSKEMEEMSQALQAMSKIMVKSMNNMTQAINESIPGVTKSMGEMAKAMAPIIKAAQENQQLQTDSQAGTNVPQPTAPTVPEPQKPESPRQQVVPMPQQSYSSSPSHIVKNPAGDSAVFETEAPKRIQLFPAPQPNY